MEIVRTKSQSVALTTRLSQFFDKTENREVISTVAEFRSRNGFLFRHAEHLFTGVATLFIDEIDALKRILTRAGGSSSRSSITQAGLSHMIQYLANHALPEDDSLLDALMFVVFQIHSSMLRRGGASLYFRVLEKYLTDKGRGDKNAFLSVHFFDKVPFILVNGKTTTYVCVNKNAKVVKDVAHANGHYVNADTIGSMKKNLEGIDALTFMTLKSEDAHTVTYMGKSYEIGQLYYRQLAAEVSTLIKIKRASCDANASKVIMHGNTGDGFVRRMNDEMKKRATGVLLTLDGSNAKRFINKGFGRDEVLTYIVDDCFIKCMSTDKGSCVMMDNINLLFESKLLHDAGIGSVCKNCGVTGTTLVLKQLTERGVDIAANIKEMTDALKPVTPVAVSTEADLTTRIVQSGGATYLPRQEYSAVKKMEKEKGKEKEVGECKDEQKSEEADKGSNQSDDTFKLKMSTAHNFMDTIVAGAQIKNKKSEF